MKGLVLLTRVCSLKASFLNKNPVFQNSQRAFVILPALSQQLWGSKKKTRKVKLQFPLETMGDPKIEEVLAPLRAAVKEQVKNNYEKVRLRIKY